MKTATETKHHLPWALGIVLLPFLMAGTIFVGVLGSILLALTMIPMALMGRLTLTVKRGK